jgi:endogenous inhibitor of DNA gyrase (YacG/DUF329 family)
MTTAARYCARRTCFKVLVRRAQESTAQFEVRRFCSVRCSNLGLSRNAPHGTFHAISLHWLRNEPYCSRCAKAIAKELARTAA